MSAWAESGSMEIFMKYFYCIYFLSFSGYCPCSLKEVMIESAAMYQNFGRGGC